MARIFVTDNKYETDVIKVCRVENPYDADLLFFVADNKYEADNKDEIWFFTDNKYDATALICWVDNKYEADVLVYKIDSKYEAKWQSSNIYVARLG